MVTYGGMSKKPVTVSTSSFIFKVSPSFPTYDSTYNMFGGSKHFYLLRITLCVRSISLECLVKCWIIM